MSYSNTQRQEVIVANLCGHIGESPPSACFGSRLAVILSVLREYPRVNTCIKLQKTNGIKYPSAYLQQTQSTVVNCKTKQADKISRGTHHQTLEGLLLVDTKQAIAGGDFNMFDVQV